MFKQVQKALQWRYAVKIFDATKKLSDEQLNVVLEAGRLAPSSLGVQPWKYVVVKDAKIRTELRKNSWDQAQITDASDLIVLCRQTTLDEAYVDKVMKHTAELRSMNVGQLAGLKQMIMGKLLNSSQQDLAVWSAEQIYLALGFMLETAAILEVDSCPMEGFDAKKYDEILGLSEKGLSSVVVCALGFRSDKDKYAHVAKARLPKSEVVLTI